MRSTRNQPFCWQEKKILRLLRKKYSKSELVKLRCLYGTITEIDSDFNSRDIKYFTKTIHSYSGLSMDWIPKGLKILERMNMIQIIEDREGGRWKGKRLVFTPEHIEEIPRKTVPGKPGNGKPGNGKPVPSEDSTLLEDSLFSEQNSPPKTDPKELTEGAKVNLLIKELCELHKAFSGQNPNVDGKAIGQLKSLLKRYSVDQIKKNLKRFYSFDFWFTKNGGRSLSVFYSKYDEIVTGKGTPIKSDKQKKEVDPQKAYEDFMKG